MEVKMGNVFNQWNEDAREREIRERTVHLGEGEREIGRPVEFPPSAQDRVVKIHPGGVEEVEKQGDPRRFFRCGGLEFMSLLAAEKMVLANMLSASPAVEAVTLEGESRPKLREEMLREIEEQIKLSEEVLISKLTETLLKPGPCREVLICGNEFSLKKRERLEQEREDLKVRLSTVFGGDFNLLLTYWLRPGIFKKVVESLPEGKTESELLAERQESAKRDLERHRERIKEVRDYLKKLK
jgi:hypothetical protein